LSAGVEDLRTHLGISGSAEDARLRALLLAVGASMAGPEGLGRDPWRQVYQERFSLFREVTSLLPSAWPVESIASAVVDGVTLDATSYEVLGRQRDTLYRSNCWPITSCPHGLRLQYVAGWLMPEQVSDWSGTASVSAGSWTRSSDPSVLLRFECTTAGDTAGTEPTWSSIPGETVVDGTVVWTAREATEQPEDVMQAALIAAAGWYSGDLEVPAGIASESDVAGSVRYASQGNVRSLPPVLRSVLAGYR
jgi:hypothetical protein